MIVICVVGLYKPIYQEGEEKVYGKKMILYGEG